MVREEGKTQQRGEQGKEGTRKEGGGGGREWRGGERSGMGGEGNGRVISPQGYF